MATIKVTRRSLEADKNHRAWVEGTPDAFNWFTNQSMWPQPAVIRLRDSIPSLW